MTIEIKVPDIGDFDGVEIIEVLVKAGDTVVADQSIITVESDKASMEIPCPQAGVVKEMKVKIGDKVAQGTLMLILEPAEGGAAAPAPAAKAEEKAEAPKVEAPKAEAAPKAAPTAVPAPVASSAPVPAEQHNPTAASVNAPHASPSVRKFARELGVNLVTVQGTGPKGRITPDDVRNFVKAAVAGVGSSTAGVAKGGSGVGLDLLPWPKVDFTKFGEIEEQELSRIKKLSGPNLHRNWVMIPHVTQFDEADITDLEQFRKDTNAALAKQGVKLTMLAFVMKACVAVLKKYPAFNASLSEAGDKLIVKKYWNIGFAADTPNGLMVPVIKGVDQKGFSQIANELGELSAQARDGKLKGADMQGATFTVSSLGGVGGTYFTPIINAPEVAILGLSKSAMKPVWNGKEFEPRLMLPLSLSYDHRVIDGAMAARFTTELAGVLADMRKVLL
ncbi:MAG: dihydrolipoyllysine-residue acetyltransferase [Gammaproteobacteria bacterium]|uniref:dihydrolipoyllysine-residue acetyltransferase n=1 Tax=Limnobacter sp. TaxID=2003368 RepID=UPI001DA327CF|nr:dihydrolipoyllysine-residue acetyltransferase [Limnobacter sp.]MBU0782970.1 dihydrolipoyllysine-residue acetyltransferase [Gammaproteobacteria bacterium]MBU0849557.1 dihydrolipoyllysine-residue acetyltransferase [Gammaproteobacteria bacterium]MBU1268028.1 dihydrolipoyllysine-residue acetyltransferase [Gammaproteobacteria bacterium]MBU1529020.1 dihydrolipoyllysine-residue acetyltransferase [Gammaproteobacteria bacterium]MBU1779422.1 dihydrolipoyllysine-residue acetyltransferase [Gammaproteob